MLLLGAQSAHAQGASKADQLFQDGRRAMAQGQYEKACAMLEASQQADPAAGTLLNLGECYEKWGKIASAWETYSAALESARKSKREEWVQIASERVAALGPKVPKVRITGKIPLAARIEIDSKPFDKSAVGSAVPMNQDTHRIVVLEGNQTRFATTFATKDGSVTEVVLDVPEKSVAATPAPGPAAAAGAPMPAPTPPPPDTRPRAGTSPFVWVMAGASLAAAGVGGALLLVRNGQVSDTRDVLDAKGCYAPGGITGGTAMACQSILDANRPMGFAPPTIAFVASGALAIGAISMYFATKPDSNEATARTVCAPALGGGTCLVRF